MEERDLGDPAIPGSFGETSGPAPIPETPISEARIAAAPTPPRFCGNCGTPWEPAWKQCQACLGRRKALPLELPGGEERRRISLVLAFYFALLAVCVAGLIANLARADSANVVLVITAVLSALVLIWAGFQWKSTLSGLWALPSYHWFFAALGLSIVTFTVGTVVISTINGILHLPPVRLSDGFLNSGYGWGTIILVVVVQPAVIEELAFRGIILGGLLRALRVSEAVIVSALMFMVLHLAPARFPHTLALGLASGFVRVRSKSIYPCILMHFSHNFLCVAAEWLGR